MASRAAAAAATGRRRIVGLSTKTYFSLARTNEYTTSLTQRLASASIPGLDAVDVFLIPDFVSLPSAGKILADAGGKVWLGAQDCHWEDSGAFTGEVSPAVLAEAGARIVEVGHAERRRLFGEDDAVTAKKAAAVARNGMVPLVCIGEKTTGEIAAAVAEVETQVAAVLEAVNPKAPVVLAYEPVWAIGAAQPAGEAHILDVVAGIRGLACVKGREGEVRVVYGGSAGPGLFERLASGLDGLFLGRFGHDVDQFVRTVGEVASA